MIKKIIYGLFEKAARRFIVPLKSPKMIYGYMDSTGHFRPRTRCSDTVFFYRPEKIKIADNVFIWHYTIIDGTGGITIEEGCQIGAWVGIFTHSSHIAIRIYGNHYQEVPETEKQVYFSRPVYIGKYSFIGPRTVISPGVTIGKGVLISAGSVINGNIDDYAIVSGSPSKVTGDTRKLDKRYLKDPKLLHWYEEWQK